MKLLQEQSEVAAGLVQSEIPDDFGWGYTLEQMWKERSRPKGLLLTGPDGCGKHTAAAHMLRILQGEHYDCAVITDSVLEALRELPPLTDWMDDKQKICVIVDQLTDKTIRSKLLSYLGRRISRNSLISDTAGKLFVIVIEREYSNMPAELRRNLLNCTMSLPASEFREVFLENQLSDLFDIDWTQYTSEEFDHLTEGLTYAQLKDLSYQIGLAIQSSSPDKVQEEILQLAKAQKVCSSERSAAERLCDFMDTIPELIDRIEEASSERSKAFLQELASAIEKLPAVQYGGTVLSNNAPETASASAAQAVQDEAAMQKAEEERIRNMPPNELIAEVFSLAGLDEEPELEDEEYALEDEEPALEDEPT